MTANAPTRLHQLRHANLAMLDGADDATLRRQSHPQLSPLLWHVGHVFFVETYWLAEHVFGDTRETDTWRHLYFPEDCPKDERSARLPDAGPLRAWAARVSAENDAYWRAARRHAHPLLARGYLAAFVRQHYAQHLETMRLAVCQQHLARIAADTPCAFAACPPVRDARSLAGGRVTVGTPGIEAYDNEQPCWSVELQAFDIARRPVSNAEWLGFVEAGGYDRPAWWDTEGWAWRTANGIRHPQHWHAMDRGWFVPGAADTPLSRQPVHGLSWYEARAFARYAGARLPSEFEWEAARRADALDAHGEVWEWCDNDFAPYPGFRAFPYDGYSRPWFDGAHAVARGGSRLSEPEIRRPGFRNFYPRSHRHVFAGLRLAW